TTTLTRRTALALAGASAAAAVTATAATAATAATDFLSSVAAAPVRDPIFLAINRHKLAWDALSAAVGEVGKVEFAKPRDEKAYAAAKAAEAQCCDEVGDAE